MVVMLKNFEEQIIVSLRHKSNQYIQRLFWQTFNLMDTLHLKLEKLVSRLRKKAAKVNCDDKVILVMVRSRVSTTG